MKFALANGGVSDNGAAPFRGNCGELRHEEERACGSVRNDWTLEFDCESVRQPGLHHRRRGGRCSRLIFGRIVNATALPAKVGSAQPIAHCGVLPVEFNKRCDVAWPPGLGKRAETFPKKGSIPSHGATFNADCQPSRDGLKHETDPACPECGQGFAAHGGRRLFNGRNAQADAQRVAVGVGQISSLQRHAKPEFSAGPSTTFTDPAQTHSVRGVFARTRVTVIRVTGRMERIANRAVRPVVVGRKVA